MPPRVVAPFSERGFSFLAAGLIILTGVLAYSNTFANGFVWDDASSVLLHEHVRQPSKFFQLFREDQHAFGRGQGNFYRPLLSASFMLDYALSRPDDPSSEPSPFLFHCSSLAWHILATLFLFALLTRLGAPRFVRLIAPLLYVVHPLHTEAVTYISGRADSMAAAFMFAGLWTSMWDESRRRLIVGHILTPLCFIAALLSKESAAIFPALLLLFALIRPRTPAESQTHRPLLWRALLVGTCVALLAVYVTLRMTVLHFAPAANGAGHPLTHRLTEASQALAAYSRLFFVPTGLHMERTLAGMPAWGAAFGAILIAILVVVAVFAFLRGKRRLVLALGLFGVAWLPVSGIIPLNAPMAEHWMYVPLAGILWALAELLEPLNRRPRTAPIVAVGVLALAVAYVALTVDRNQDWRDNASIYRATLDENPWSARVNFNLAVTYDSMVGNSPGARRHYEWFLRLYEMHWAPNQTGPATEEELEAHLALGRIYLAHHRYDEAAEHFGTILGVPTNGQFPPIVHEAALGLGKCLLAQGQIDGAREVFAEVPPERTDLAVEIDGLLRRAGG